MRLVDPVEPHQGHAEAARGTDEARIHSHYLPELPQRLFVLAEKKQNEAELFPRRYQSEILFLRGAKLPGRLLELSARDVEKSQACVRARKRRIKLDRFLSLPVRLGTVRVIGGLDS